MSNFNFMPKLEFLTVRNETSIGMKSLIISYYACQSYITVKLKFDITTRFNVVKYFIAFHFIMGESRLFKAFAR